MMGSTVPPPPPREPSEPETRTSRANRFINSLLELARPEEEKYKDRAAMAALRGSLRGTPADFYRAAQYVVGFLEERESADDRWFYLVGGLFALHPQHRTGVSLGKACQALRDDKGSMDNRILALLNTRAEALPRVLRQMVTLLESRGIGLDYKRLLDQLCQWDAPDNRVQKQWARDYFRDPKTAKAESNNDSSDDSDDVTEEENNEN